MAARRLALFALLSLSPLACNLALSDALGTSAGRPTRDVTFNESDAAAPTRAGAGSNDMGAAPPSQDAGKSVRGSPLCNAPRDGGTCWPDEGACGAAMAPGDDAGADAADAGATPTGYACRVRIQDEAVQPVCAASGGGGEGAQCMRSSDCASGFECVQSPGRCRRYCCSLQCDDTQRFCDLQPTAPTAEQPGLLVPVCTALQACKLLGDGCGPDRTCGVVRPDGTTSCVTAGDGRAGDGCEREPCAAGLVCLGQPGSRRCYKLCDVNDARACPSGQACRGTAPLFKDDGVGVCE